MLELDDLACERGGRALFAGLCASVGAGSALRVEGANGAGKTSLLRMVCGLSAPARGEVRWQGEPIGRLREEYAGQLVYLGHAAALKDDLSATENLQAACCLAGMRVPTTELALALAASGLQGREHLPVRVLSQGQRRRVALARLALPAPPPLWVLDEPFNALDNAAVAWLLNLLEAHLRGGGLLVLTSHQPVALRGTVREAVLAL
jgi:heme exporter protein A